MQRTGALASGIVIPGLEHVDPGREDPVDEAILPGDPSAPQIRAEVAERLRLPFAWMRTARRDIERFFAGEDERDTRPRPAPIPLPWP